MEKKIIINIGRQFGSGGHEIAHKLGNLLNIPVYDNELLTEAAKENGFDEKVFAGSDEKKRPFFLSSILSRSNVYQGDNFTDNMLFKMQSQTIKNIAEKGSAIIVGRCSNYILRDFDCCLNIFITAPLESRCKRIASRDNSLKDKDFKALSKYILQKDDSRRDYYNYYTFGNWGVCSTYDLSLDSSILGIEGTAEFIIEYAKKAGKLRISIP